MKFLLCLQCGFVPVGWSHANAIGGVLIGTLDLHCLHWHAPPLLLHNLYHAGVCVGGSGGGGQQRQWGQR